MAIVKMNKFTLLAFESEKEKLLEELQSFEGVEFVDLQRYKAEKEEDYAYLEKDSVNPESAEYEENLSQLKYTLDILQKYAKPKSGLKAFLSDKKTIPYAELKSKISKIHWKTVYEDIKRLQDELGFIGTETVRLETEINNLSFWAGFDGKFRDLKDLRFCSYFIGTVSRIYEAELPVELQSSLPASYFEIINKDKDDAYILLVALSEDEANASDILKKFGFRNIVLNYDDSPRDIIRNYEDKIADLKVREAKIKEELGQYTGKIEELEYVYEYNYNYLNRLQAASNFLKTEKVVTLAGWVTEESKEEFINTVKGALGENHHLEFIEIDDSTEVPIKLKNNSFAQSFEGIVEMYSLPAYHEVDPTPILAIFYFIFFGAMLSDAGYGLIMVVASAFALSRIKEKEKRKNYKLFLYAGISTMIWGAAYGGYFGDLFAMYLNVKMPYLIDPAKGITQILVISIVFGLVHIFIGLGIKAYILIKHKKILDAIFDVLLWYFTLVGAILMGLSVGGSLGWILLTVGLVGLLLTQGRSAPSIGGKIGGGIYGVYGITGYLGDVVSYSRLLALGLATGFIANALNLIISLVPSPFNLILAPIMFVALHMFNFLVNALGSYVHAARLQYLEFFSKFYEGGGRKFNPFRLSDKFIKITK
jgi:V/A-type H+/Na+-transporting ATPase subunit I